MGDTVAHDKLVCLKKGANTGNNICRNFDISFENTDAVLNETYLDMETTCNYQTRGGFLVRDRLRPRLVPELFSTKV